MSSNTKSKLIAVAIVSAIIFVIGLNSKANAQVSGQTVFRLLGSKVSTFLPTWALGVGTSTPNAKLTVQGTAGANTTNILNVASSTGASLLAVAPGGTTTVSKLLVGFCDGCAAGGVTSVTGTANQVTSSGGATPVLSLPSLVIFPSSASSTLFSNVGTAYFGGTATSSFNSGGDLTLVNDLFFSSTGAVIDFFAGDVTLTHGANVLTLGGGNLALGTNSLTLTGSIGATGARATKVWATDVESSNMYTVGGTSLASTFGSLASTNTWSALNMFSRASSTQMSVFSNFYAGGTATTTIDSLGRINVAGASTTPQRDIVYNTATCVEGTLTDAATVTWNLATNSCAKVTLGGNRTLDITNETVSVGQPLRLVVCQDGTGSRTLASDAAIRWAGGVAPTLTTTAGHCDTFAGFTTGATSTTVVFLGVSANF